MQKTFVYHENASGDDLFRIKTDTYTFNEESMVFAIADSPLRAITRQNMNYPFDDWSAVAADLFCETFVESASEYIQEHSDYSTEQLRKDLTTANNAIRLLNQDLEKKYNDPANYDIAETVGMVAIVNNGKLYYGGLEDCYVNLLDGKTLKDKHKFNYQIMKASKYLDRLARNGKLSEFTDPVISLPEKYNWEPVWAGYLRNNTKVKDKDGNFVGFGMFTGEKEAIELMQLHEIDIKEGDHLLLFSNGFVPIVNNEEFMNWFITNVNNSFAFQTKILKQVRKVSKNTSVEASEKLLLYIKI